MNGFEDILAPFVYGGPSFGFLVGHNRIPALEYAVAEEVSCVSLAASFASTSTAVIALPKWAIG